MLDLFRYVKSILRPININNVSMERTSFDFDWHPQQSFPLSDALDALVTPGSNSSLIGFDRERSSSATEHGTSPAFQFDEKPTGINFGINLNSHRTTSTSVTLSLDQPCQSVVEEISWSGTDYGFLSSSGSYVEPPPRYIKDLLEEDALFRITASTDGPVSLSSISRGMDTNLAQLQVAGDVLLPPSLALEEEWDQLSLPDLSNGSDTSDEISPILPPTPLDEVNCLDSLATVEYKDDVLDSPLTSISSPLSPSSPPDSPEPVSPCVSTSEVSASKSDGKKRKRESLDSLESEMSRASTPESPSVDAPFKWFTLIGRSTSRHSAHFQTKMYTKFGESCCNWVGDKGYCKFETLKDGKKVTCGEELIRDAKILYPHISFHLEEGGYNLQAKRNPTWKPECPWCLSSNTTYDNFARHIVYTELAANAIVCDCGGTISRSNQIAFVRRHEASKMHRDWTLENAEANSVEAVKEEELDELEKFEEFEEEFEESEEEFVQGNSTGTKRRRLK